MSLLISFRSAWKRDFTHIAKCLRKPSTCFSFLGHWELVPAYRAARHGTAWTGSPVHRRDTWRQITKQRPRARRWSFFNLDVRLPQKEQILEKYLMILSKWEIHVQVTARPPQCRHRPAQRRCRGRVGQC